ncbi:MAG: beta-lactamase family protein, partial [Actinomycetota bacterium]|nr:beta-lactamase family protein [Actinomycetota bacterium]
MPTTEARVTECINSWLAANANVPGMIVLVRDGDREVCASLGFADRDRSERISSAHVFRIASNTKSFVAVATMRFIEAGVLVLDDPVASVLPSDVHSLLAPRYDLSAITLRMLLQHTSGIASHDADNHDGTSPFLDAVKANPTHRWNAIEQ